MFLLHDFLACAVIALGASAPPEVPPASQAVPPTPKAPDASDPSSLYPPVRTPTVVHVFSLPEEVKADVVRKALADLSTKEADCKIVFGPVKATARPKKVMVMIEAPAALDAKDVAKAIRKGAGSAESVAWTCFMFADSMSKSGLDTGMPGMTPRDFVLSMSNEMHWFEMGGGLAEFFVTPGKMGPSMIADRFHKLAQPFGVKDLGGVVEIKVEWSLQGADANAALDEAAAKRVEKALAKLPGVKSAGVDAAKRMLSFTVVLADLVRSGPVLALPVGHGEDKPADPNAAPPPRMRFDTNAVLDVLEKEHWSATAAKKEGEDAGPKKGG